MTAALAPQDLSRAVQFAHLPQAERDTFLASLTEQEALYLQYDWSFWGRPKQIAPEGDWVYWFLMAGRGFGKALCLNTPLPTPDGWTTMGEVKEGDSLLDERGMVCRVVFATPVQVDRRCYKVAFSDGSEVIADADHLWLTSDRVTRKALRRRVAVNMRLHVPQSRPKYAPSLRTTEQISKSLYDGKEVNHSVEIATGLILPYRELPIPPYVLGVWLGDGSSNGPQLTCADSQILEEIQSEGCQIVPYKTASDKTPMYGIDTFRLKPGHNNPDSMRTKLRDLNVTNNKHIPMVYLRASYAQRLSLLQGLMDTDGYCNILNGNCEYTSINKRLIENVYELLMTMGIKAVLSTGRATIYGKDCGEKYRINFTPYLNVFRLQRKLDCLRKAGSQAARQRRRYITCVEPVDSVPVRCIQVDSPSHLFLCGKSFIPTHNTVTLVKWALEKAYALPKSRGLFIGATTEDVRDILILGDSGILNQAHPDFMPTYNQGKNLLIFPNGTTVNLRSAEKPDRLRGPQFHWGIADEIGSWRYAVEAWDMIQFGLRLGQHPQLAVASTPRPTPLVISLLKNPHTVITRGTTYENREHLAPSFYSQIITKYEGTRLGRQELLAELLTDTPGALWKREQIDATRVAITPYLKRTVVAVDPAASSNSESNETGVVVCAIGNDDHLYVLDDMTIQGTPNEWGMQVFAAYHKHHADAIVIETNQGGDMAENVLRVVAKELGLSAVAIHQVRASKGKTARAEPIAALYEQGRAHHVGMFGILEDQMCTWVKGEGMESPDRCFPAGTMITTANGNIPIEQIQSGEEVLTRVGYRRVTESGMTSSESPILHLMLSYGIILECTHDHPIFVLGRGFVPAWTIKRGEQVAALASKLSTSKALNTDAIRIAQVNQPRGTLVRSSMVIAQKVNWHFIARSGSIATVLFCRAIKFITLMATSVITIFLTLKCFPQKSIASGIKPNSPNNGENTLRILDRLHLNGTGAKQVLSGIESTARKHGKNVSLSSNSFAQSVEMSLIAILRYAASYAFALGHASTVTTIKPSDIHLSESVLFAAKPSLLSAPQEKVKCVPLNVLGLYAAPSKPVYNLTVEDQHEYFANGILVHNCDALVWAGASLFPLEQEVTHRRGRAKL